MSHRLLPAILGCALVLAGGCTGDRPATGPSGPAAKGSPLLEPQDLPDGYATSPPEAAPEMSTVSRVSVEGCEALLDRFRDGGAAPADSAVRFEAGSTGPFLAEELSADAGSLRTQTRLAEHCDSFTDTDADGTTTTVTVTPVTDFPALGDERAVFRMSAGGGTGDDAFSLSGYLVVVRRGGTTCTLVHFGQPEVDRAETEMIARTAVKKL